MGFTTVLFVAGLIIGGTRSDAAPSTEAARPQALFQHLDPGATVVEGRLGLTLELPRVQASAEDPLWVVVTGLASGHAPFELDRRRFDAPGQAFAVVRHGDLRVWDEVVVTWWRPTVAEDEDGGRTGPASGFLARVQPRPEASLESPSTFTGAVAGAAASTAGKGGGEPKIEGGVVTYECPSSQKAGCTVHLFMVDLKTGKLEDNPIPLDAGQFFSINTSLAAAHYCTGCK